MSESTSQALLVRNVFPNDFEKIHVLADGVTPEDFTDTLIKERQATECEDAFYVGNLDLLMENHLRWKASLPRVTPFYAVKCNHSPVMVRTLSILGTGFDCASKGEIEMTLSHGVTPDKIVYAHTTKSRSCIKYARSQDVDLMTFDGEDELHKVAQLYPTARLVLRIVADDSSSIVRLNDKFGATMKEVNQLLQTAKDLDLNVMGVSFHVGVLCGESSCFTKAIADAREVFDMATTMGFRMRVLDLGGGYDGKEPSKMNLEQCALAINESLAIHFPPESGVKIIAEPGSFYAQSIFTVTANVVARRVVKNENDESLINYYINEGRFGSFSLLVNHPGFLNLEPKLHRAVPHDEPKVRSVIWGPTCDCVDKVLDETWLPEMEVDDWIHFSNMGAYSISLQCDFNGFERTKIYYILSEKNLQKLVALLKKSSEKSDKCIVLQG